MSKSMHIRRITTNASKSEIMTDYISAMRRRSRKERKDSVTNEILLDRFNHKSRYSAVAVSTSVTSSLQALGLGLKKKRGLVYAKLSRTPDNKFGGTRTGAGKNMFSTFAYHENIIRRTC